MSRQQVVAAAAIVFVLTGVWFSSRPPAPAAATEKTVPASLPTAEALIVTVTSRPRPTASPTIIVLTFQAEPTLEVLSPTAFAVELPTAFPVVANTPISNPQSPDPTAGTLPPTAAPPPPTAYVPPPPPPAADPSVAAAEQNVIDQVNYQRSLSGMGPLGRDETLMSVARSRSGDMAVRGYFSHYDPQTGAELGRSQILGLGFGRATENIFRSGQELSLVPGQAVGWFMTDYIHRIAILDEFYTVMGAGIARDGLYWNVTVVFAN